VCSPGCRGVGRSRAATDRCTEVPAPPDVRFSTLVTTPPSGARALVTPPSLQRARGRCVVRGPPASVIRRGRVAFDVTVSGGVYPNLCAAAAPGATEALAAALARSATEGRVVTLRGRIAGGGASPAAVARADRPRHSGSCIQRRLAAMPVGGYPKGVLICGLAPLARAAGPRETPPAASSARAGDRRPPSRCAAILRILPRPRSSRAPSGPSSARTVCMLRSCDNFRWPLKNALGGRSPHKPRCGPRM